MSDFTPTAEGLAKYAMEWLIKPNIYLWGGTGEFLTDEVLDQKIARWPEWYTPENVEFRRMLCNRGIKCFDCIGLIQAYLWNDYSQYNTGYYKNDEFITTHDLIAMDIVKHPMNTLPERPGLVLWRKWHVGVYVGNGMAVEATVRTPHTNIRDSRIGGLYMSSIKELTQWSGRAWQYWLEYPGIEY